MLEDLEQFASSLPALESKASALILYSEQKAGFSAGADLRELYEGAQKLTATAAAKGVRNFLERIHAALNQLDFDFSSQLSPLFMAYVLEADSSWRWCAI